MICLTILFVLLIACDGKKEKDEKKEEAKTSYIGPGTFGIPDEERPDTSKIDLGYLLNVDGTYTEPTTTDNGCPLIYGVNTRRWQKTDKCDPNFDYTALVEAAATQALDFAQTISCPERCPFREGYPDPSGDHWIRWECIQQVDGGFLYFVSYTGYFVCTDVQG